MNLRLSNFIASYVDPLNLICPNIIFPSLVSARFFPRQFSPALYYLNAWNRLNVGDFWWSWIFNDFIQLQKKKGIFVVVIHGLVALGAFTSKSCVGRERNVIKSVIHVQSCCFAHKSNCFSTLSLSSASSLTVLGSLSKDVFERRTSTGSEAFSLFIRLDTTKFVLPSFFSPIKTIYLRVSTKPQPNAAKSPLPVDVSRSKTLLLKLPIVSPPRLECRYIEMGIPLEYSWVENLFSDCMTDHLFLKGSADYCL